MAQRSAFEEARNFYEQLTARVAPVAQQVQSFVRENPTPIGFVQSRVVPRAKEIINTLPTVSGGIVSKVVPHVQQRVAQTPIVPFLPQLTPQRLMQFQAPLEPQAQRLPQSVQSAFPITQVPSFVGESVRQIGRLTGLQPTKLDIATLPLLFMGGVKAKPGRPLSSKMIAKLPTAEAGLAGKTAGIETGARGVPPSPIIRPLPTTPKLKTQVSSSINKAAQILAERNPEDPIVTADTPRLFKRIGEGLRVGRITVDDVPELKKYGLTETEAADLFEHAATFGGRTLNYLSQTARHISKLFPKDFAAPEVPPTAWDTISQYPRNVMNLWRASLVSQMATAMRNFASFSGRYVLGTIDDALAGTMETVLNKRPPREAFAPMIEDIFALTRRLNPQGRRRLVQILDAEPIIKAKLYNTPVVETVMGKWANFINTFNRTQEFIARNLVIDAKITSGLIRKGLNPKTIQPSEIPLSVLKSAVDTALDYTFAATPKAKMAAQFVRWWNQYPFFTNLIYPFPRYLSNALRTLYEISPAGVTAFLKPETRALLAKGDRRAFEIISRASIGSAAFLAAAYLRNSDYAGEKWYEIKFGDKRIDTRPFGPLLPVYMFIAEAMKDPSKMENRDWIEGMLGINRIAGTTLFLTSLLSGQGPDNVKKAIVQYAGEFLGGFTIPFRTFRDFVAVFSQEEAIARSTKEQLLLGPALANIPVISRKLPELPKITRREPVRYEHPGLRQITGLTIRTKTPFESEIDRVGIRARDLYPKTGEAKIDRYITEVTGGVMEVIGSQLINDPRYGQLNDDSRTELFKKAFSSIKKDAKEKVLINYANEIAQDVNNKLKGKSKEQQKEILFKLKNKGLLTRKVLLALLAQRQTRLAEQ